MGFRSTLTSEHYAINWPTWFKEKYKNCLKMKWYGGDAIFLEYPIKSPFLEIYDNLTAMADEIEHGKPKELEGA